MAKVPWTSRLQRGSITILGSLFVVLVALRTVIAGQIDITVKAVKASLLVGEPLVLSVRIRADVPVVVPTDLMSPGLPFRVLLDRGSGFVPYVEHVLSPAPEGVGSGSVPDGVTREFVLGFDETSRDWTFPAPGTYRLMVEYLQPTGSPLRSNEVTVTVQAPTGPDQEVRDRLRQLGPELVVAHESEPLGSLESLAQDHPQSPYLHERRWRDLDSRMGAIAGGYEPTTQYLDPPSPQNHLPDVVVSRARDLLSLALELGEVPGQFQPDALLKLGHLYYMAGEPERGREVFERIIREFPDREAARVAGGAVGDDAPPTPPPITETYYLHGSEGYANPLNLRLTKTAPGDSTVKYKDLLRSIQFSGGNPWKLVGWWMGGLGGTPPGSLTRSLTGSGDLRLWLGLTSSGDQGTQFDVKATLSAGSVTAGSGTLLCVTGLTSTAAQAREVAVPIVVPTPVPTGPGKMLVLGISTRIGTNPNGTQCAGRSSASGLRVYFDAITRPASVPVAIQP